MRDETRPLWPLVLLGVTLIFWSGAFVAIRQLLKDLSPISLTVLRFLLGSGGFAVVWGWRAVRGHRLAVPDGGSWLLLAGFALFGIVGYHVPLNIGEQTVSAGIASVIVSLAPAITAAIVYAAGVERVRPVAILGMGVAFVGVTIVSLLGSPGAQVGVRSLAGPAIVLISPTSWALATLMAKRLVERMDAVDLTAIGTWIGTAVLLPFMPRGFASEVAALSPGAWGLMVYLAAGATVFGYVAWNLALARYRATNVAATVYLIPPLTMLLGWVFLSEAVTVWLAVGTVAIIGGVALVERARQQASPA